MAGHGAGFPRADIVIDFNAAYPYNQAQSAGDAREGVASSFLHDMIRIKVISHALTGYGNGRGRDVVREDCIFLQDAHCRDYDWLVVYDDFPRASVGSIRNETEPLACPSARTILVTAEPPSIKIYPAPYTRQFGHVLTTHPRRFLSHPGYRIGRGCMYWMAGYSMDEVLSMPDRPKSRDVSAVCSAKRQRHTQHRLRYRLMTYLTEHLEGFEWYGWGVRDIRCKYEALNDYRYHVAAENYIGDHHWSDKISDPLLALCLTFYAGDPKLAEILPAESFIPIPIDDEKRALAVIREAIARNEYERRLPAIREARRLIVEKYNFYQQIVDLIHEQSVASAPQGACRRKGEHLLKGRHTLRRNPCNALAEGVEILRYRTSALFDCTKH